ncbi:MAG: sensor histidine kinase [Minisyncoccales bacterium]
MIKKKSVIDYKNEINSLKKEIIKQKREYEQKLKKKESLINRIVHDLKSPLLPLKILLPLVENKMRDQHLKKNIAICNKNVNYMCDIISRSLSILWIKNNQNKNYKTVNLKKLIKNTIETRLSVFQHIDFNIECKNDKVKIDDIAIKEVLNNILDNAKKHMPKGGKIKISSKSTKDKVTVTIKDSGIGMKKNETKVIFKDFKKRTDCPDDLLSVGLGLSISKKIIEEHHGKIWAESNGLGKGTSFNFTLPKAKI